MPGLPLILLSEGVTGLGVHEIEKGTDAEIVLQLLLLGRRQLVVLVLDDQLMQAVQIALLEFHPEEGLRPLIRQIIFLRPDDAVQNGRFVAAGSTLHRCHSLILALVDVTLAVILAETFLPTNVTCNGRIGSRAT
jgi:hypothetical protein